MWHPIETAPKDGSFVDLWANEDYPDSNCYQGNRVNAARERAARIEAAAITIIAALVVCAEAYTFI